MGIEAEERGERAAYGNKAQRHYEEALTCYQAAIQIAGQLFQLKKLADSAYNAATVFYLLNANFYMPATALPALDASAKLYRKAEQSVTTSCSEELSPPGFALDIASNLCATLLALFEIIDDVPEVSGLDFQSVKARMAALASEAILLLGKVEQE